MSVARDPWWPFAAHQEVGWEESGRRLFRGLAAFFDALARIQAEHARACSKPDRDAAAVEAAALLSVRLDATADEVRAALRRKLAASRLHPDHGGDGEQAKRLIAAKNLLVARARVRS